MGILPPFDPLTLVDAPHPDLFDKDIAELEFDWSWPFQQSILPGDTFPIHRDLAPASTSPSVFTYSTESSSDTAPSEYSYPGPPSDHSTLTFQSVGVNSVYGGVDTIDDLIHPSLFLNILTSFESLPPLRTLSLPDQQGAIPSAPAVPAQAIPDTQPRSGPTREHQCDKCGHCKTDSSEYSL